jgi:release factor glutamine methyltransferase
VIFFPALRGTISRLREAGFDNPGLEARLLAEAAGDDRAQFDALLTRRLAHEPMAYLLGRRGFWTLDLEVSPATLIPRPDSETLIEAALAALPDRASVRTVLDLGTGTGCLLLAALAEFPAAWGLGIDLEPTAIALAVRNARMLGLADRAHFVCADWAAPIGKKRFDLILCNPPYIATGEIGTLMPEVARFEPRIALDGGADGLDAYRALVPMVPALLGEGGVAIFEIGQGQAAAVGELAARNNLAVALRHDLGGIARALVLRNAGA